MVLLVITEEGSNGHNYLLCCYGTTAYLGICLDALLEVIMIDCMLSSGLLTLASDIICSVQFKAIRTLTLSLRVVAFNTHTVTSFASRHDVSVTQLCQVRVCGR